MRVKIFELVFLILTQTNFKKELPLPDAKRGSPGSGKEDHRGKEASRIVVMDHEKLEKADYINPEQSSMGMEYTGAFARRDND